MRKLILGLILTMLCHGAAVAQSREAAVAFVKKAVAYAKQNGKDKALAAFSNPQGQFVEGELYIVALDMQGVLLADGSKPRLVGKSLLAIKDMNGKAFVRDEIELAKSQGKGWIDFEWVNPVSGKLEPRSSYFERIDDYIVVTGIYKRH
jgi:cytochrome c